MSVTGVWDRVENDEMPNFHRERLFLRQLGPVVLGKNEWGLVWRRQMTLMRLGGVKLRLCLSSDNLFLDGVITPNQNVRYRRSELQLKQEARPIFDGAMVLEQ